MILQRDEEPKYYCLTVSVSEDDQSVYLDTRSMQMMYDPPYNPPSTTSSNLASKFTTPALTKPEALYLNQINMGIASISILLDVVAKMLLILIV